MAPKSKVKKTPSLERGLENMQRAAQPIKSGGAVYVTFDRLDPDNGAGLVCLNEIEALKKATNLNAVLCRSAVESVAKDYNERKIPFTGVNIDNVYQFNPFLYDYFMSDFFRRNPVTYPDILHLSCSPGYALIDKLRPKKIVCNVVAHELATSIEEHERFYGVGTYPFKHNTDPYLHDALLAHANIADVVFTPSTHSEEWITKNTKAKRVVVIPHGCLVPKEKPPLPEGEFTLGYMGAGGPDKGLIYLLMAWDHLAYKDATLLFAGTCGDWVKQIAPSICPNGKVEVMGWVKDREEFFKRIHAAAVPSVTEGFGILTVEAMARGRPVIVSKGAGSADLIEDGKSGFWVKPRNPQMIVDTIKLIKDEGYRRKMGNVAAQRAKRYTWDKIRDRYTTVYKELLE